MNQPTESLLKIGHLYYHIELLEVDAHWFSKVVVVHAELDIVLGLWADPTPSMLAAGALHLAQVRAQEHAHEYTALGRAIASTVAEQALLVSSVIGDAFDASPALFAALADAADQSAEYRNTEPEPTR